MEICQDELYNPESIQQTPAPSSHARTSLASQGSLLSPQRKNLNNLIQTTNSSHMSARAASPANSMGSEVEAVKRQAEDHTKAMMAPLASDSCPDTEKSMGFPRATMKPTARLPFDHTCDLSINGTCSFSHSFSIFTSYRLAPWLRHAARAVPTTPTTFFDLLLCTEQHAKPVPMYHSISPPEQQHAQWCLGSSSRIPASLTSLESTKSKSLLPIISVATATSSPFRSRSFSVTSELTRPNPPFYSFIPAGAKKVRRCPMNYRRMGQAPQQLQHG